MVILISGPTHSGKTYLAQRLMERFDIPYLSIDHLKMGLIRSHMTHLTPLSDDKSLTELLWPIVREMIKTAIENRQNMIVEGCYIPFDWKKDLDEGYLKDIEYICLVMSEGYIRKHFDDIKKYGSIIEKRLEEDISLKELINENKHSLDQCISHGLRYHLTEERYDIEEILKEFDGMM